MEMGVKWAELLQIVWFSNTNKVHKNPYIVCLNAVTTLLEWLSIWIFTTLKDFGRTGGKVKSPLWSTPGTTILHDKKSTTTHLAFFLCIQSNMFTATEIIRPTSAIASSAPRAAAVPQQSSPEVSAQVEDELPEIKIVTQLHSSEYLIRL